MRTRRSGTGATISPTASTWPWTRWPPRRSSRRTGRSRLTGSPARRAPRLVREKVSSLTSASHQPSSASNATTVRQQPLTAVESPMPTPSSTVRAAMRSREPSRDTTDPSSSTMPVNMSASFQIEAKIVAQVAQADNSAPPDVGDGDRAGAREQAACVVATEERGGNVEHVAIDQPGVVEGVGHTGATLDHQLEDPLGPELVEGV